jgi:hypothetical protein
MPSDLQTNIKILQDSIHELAGANGELFEADKQKIRVLASAALGLLECFLSDVNRIADALEALD